MNLQGSVLDRGSLDAAQRDRMFALMDGCFEGVERAAFDADLDEKDQVVLLHDDSGELRAFSTLLTFETSHLGRPVGVAYSGDTIVDPAAWGSLALPRTWMAAVRQSRDRFLARSPQGEFYWMLISSGFRTYRFLPVYFRSFWPRFDVETPESVRTLMHGLAAERFGERYDAVAGLVRLDTPHRLRSELGEVAAGRLANPHVSFFLARNPGHACGDELVCLTEFSEDNLTAAGRRAWTAAGLLVGAAA